MSVKAQIHTAAPTPGPWRIQDDCLVYRHWQYAGWPNFGRIVIARLESSWPQGPERQANLELIMSAVNSCFAVAPNSPVAAAGALPALVAAAENILAYGDDPNMPLSDLKNRLEDALWRMRGGAA